MFQRNYLKYWSDKMNEINKILTDEIFEWYPNKYPFKSFINSVANFVDITGVISVAGLFLPEFIEHDKCIFFKENVEKKINEVKHISSPYGDDPKAIERYRNLFNLDEFFLFAADDACDDIRLVKKFGELLEYFWSRRLKELYPDKSFKFELAEDLYDEDGLCLTFWQE